MEFNRKLILENGTVMHGVGFGGCKEVICELVFNTSVVGYQELVSDPTYADLAVVMNYPLIGNYGITDEDFESRDPLIGALIVREYNDQPSNFRYTRTLGEYMEDHNIPGISQVDTRKLTRILRSEGVQKVMITDETTDEKEALARLKEATLPTDSAKRAGCKKRWYSRTSNPKYQVVAIDCGIKDSMMQKLKEKGCNVTVVPFDTTVDEILALQPDGVFVSNGPGDPANVANVAETISALRGKKPIFGVGLGHQLLAMAYGAKIQKMKVGHRGGNHPVFCKETDTVEICNQNHGYVVDKESLAGTNLTLTHINLLDQTCEGVECKEEKVFSLQYHPERISYPGKTVDPFDKFMNLMAQKGE